MSAGVQNNKVTTSGQDVQETAHQMSLTPNEVATLEREEPAAEDSECDGIEQSSGSSVDSLKGCHIEEPVHDSAGHSSDQGPTAPQSENGDKIGLCKEDVQVIIRHLNYVDGRLSKLESKILEMDKSRSADDGENSEDDDRHGAVAECEGVPYWSSWYEEEDHEEYFVPKTNFRRTTAREDESEFSYLGFDYDAGVCLWVLYTSTNETPLAPGTYPMPGSIEVAEFSIKSNAILSFINEEWGCYASKDSMLHMRWPFRPLLRSSERIHQHFKWLESFYGYVHKPSDSTTNFRDADKV